MNERLTKFVDYLIANRKVYNATDFGAMVHKTKSQVSEMLSGKRVITYKTATQIRDAFPELDVNWLLTGEGTMLRTPEAAPQPAISQQNVNGDNNITGDGSGEARVFKALYTEKCKENEALNLRVAKLMAKLMDLGIDINGCDL